MTKNSRFSPAYEEDHFYGLVDEGEYLRQSSLYKQIMPRTQSWPKILYPLWLYSSCSSYLRGEKISEISVNPWLINDLRSTKVYVRKNKLFLQNKANFQKVKFNVNEVLTKDYVQMDTWSIRKTKPIQSQLKPIQSQLKPIQSQLKPIQTQFKPNQTQFQSQRNCFLGHFCCVGENIGNNGRDKTHAGRIRKGNFRENIYVISGKGKR
jgi:hypothetical protein